jgi:hypothetical protein
MRLLLAQKKPFNINLKIEKAPKMKGVVFAVGSNIPPFRAGRFINPIE